MELLEEKIKNEENYIKVVESMISIEYIEQIKQIKKIAREELDKLVNTDEDAFGVDFSRYDGILKSAKIEAWRRKYHGKYNEETWEIGWDAPIRKNLAFVIGEPILEYRPYAIASPYFWEREEKDSLTLKEKAREKIKQKYGRLIEETDDPKLIPIYIMEMETVLKELDKTFEGKIKARDLFTGKFLEGSIIRQPELNCFTNKYHYAFEDGHPIPTAISAIKEDSNLNQRTIKDFEWLSRQKKKYKSICCRNMNYRPEKGCEIWYFPLWEVPITSKKEVMAISKTYMRRFIHKGWYILEHKIQFETNGALIYDGFRGTKVDSVIIASNFVGNKMNYKVRVKRKLDYKVRVKRRVRN